MRRAVPSPVIEKPQRGRMRSRGETEAASDSASVNLPYIYDRWQRLAHHLLHSRAPLSVPLVSLSLSIMFFCHPIPDLDYRQHLPRRPLHSRALLPFPPVSLSLSQQYLLRSPHSRPRTPSASPLLSSPFPNSVIISPSSLVATFSTPTAVSISLVIFSILSPQHLRSPHSRPRPRQLFPLRLWCCLELTSSPAMTKLFTDRTLS